QHPAAFLLDRPLWVTALAAQAGLHFHQFQRQPVREPLAVLAEAFGHPGRRAFAGRDQSCLHGHMIRAAPAPPPGVTFALSIVMGTAWRAAPCTGPGSTGIARPSPRTRQRATKMPRTWRGVRLHPMAAGRPDRK